MERLPTEMKYYSRSHSTSDNSSSAQFLSRLPRAGRSICIVADGIDPASEGPREGSICRINVCYNVCDGSIREGGDKCGD